MRYVAGRRTTENEVGRQFQPPLVEGLADFGREHTFVAGVVVGGNGEDIGLALGEPGDGVARDFSCREGRPRETVRAGIRADVDFVTGQIRFRIRCPCQCHVSCRWTSRRRSWWWS